MFYSAAGGGVLIALMALFKIYLGSIIAVSYTHLSILTNSTAEQSPYALDVKSINLINYDFDKYGSSDLRKRRCV